MHAKRLVSDGFSSDGIEILWEKGIRTRDSAQHQSVATASARLKIYTIDRTGDSATVLKLPSRLKGRTGRPSIHKRA